MRNHFWLSILTAVISIVVWAGTASAQDSVPTPHPVTDDEVNAIAKKMYCPVCENTPLDVCPTQACAEWRELIREKLAEGWTEKQINTYFVERFGDRVMASPPARGLNWLVYIIPPIAFLVGAFLLYRAIQSWQKPTPTAPAIDTTQNESVNDPYIDRLEEELKKL